MKKDREALASDRPCNVAECDAVQFFNEDIGKWQCIKGHIQEKYGVKGV